jgi:RES domain-containing protein
MFVYRVVKTRARAKDLSGTGAYQYGGRWNNKGTYMLYASATSSLALLENLVHFDESEFPPKLFILRIEINDNATIYTPRVDEYSPEWKHYELLENKKMGDQWMSEMEFLAIKVRSDWLRGIFKKYRYLLPKSTSCPNWNITNM